MRRRKMKFSTIFLFSSGAIPLVVANIILRTAASTPLSPPSTISPTPVLSPSPLSTPEPTLPSPTSAPFLSNTQVISVPQTTDPAKLSDLDLLSIKTNAKWHLTTYYSCVTRGPILIAGLLSVCSLVARKLRLRRGWAGMEGG
ncbi:hypothetical protein B0J14DRAFT_139598 [Halenospora varia]|nr:hypothetical protein B0J14DRAFT_139598 [Halenospora varia]